MSLRTAFRVALAPHRSVASTILANPSLCRRFLSDQSRKLIDEAVHTHPLVLFMKGTPEQPQCGFSRAVIQILDVQGVPPEKIKTYNVLEDDELRSGIKEYTEWPTVPQLFVNGEFVGGCDIVLGMHQSGELEPVLAKAGLIPGEGESEVTAKQ